MPDPAPRMEALPCPLCRSPMIEHYTATAETHSVVSGYGHQMPAGNCPLRWWVLPLRDVAAWNTRPGTARAPDAGSRTRAAQCLDNLAIDAGAKPELIERIAAEIERARAEARSAAIEECAKVARAMAGEFLSAEGRGNFIMHGPGGMAMAMVSAIRALARPSQAEGEEK